MAYIEQRLEIVEAELRAVNEKLDLMASLFTALSARVDVLEEE